MMRMAMLGLGVPSTAESARAIQIGMDISETALTVILSGRELNGVCCEMTAPHCLLCRIGGWTARVIMKHIPLSHGKIAHSEAG